jgi:hypothetical protein
MTVIALIQCRYDEIQDYDFSASKSKGGVTGHFTQVVWKDTKEVALAKSDDGVYIFANYLPGGNLTIAGKDNYRENVLPPS